MEKPVPKSLFLVHKNWGECVLSIVLKWVFCKLSQMSHYLSCHIPKSLHYHKLFFYYFFKFSLKTTKSSFRFTIIAILMAVRIAFFVHEEQCSIRKSLYATGGTTSIVNPHKPSTSSMIISTK